ncbi:MAG: transposase [Acetobacteraceae bacterium]|nr:transposase [Acetobacteraceae bacterium]
MRKLNAFTDQQHASQQYLRELIWWFYADLKSYRREPTARRRGELLRVLDRPEVPLNTNGSENDIRCQVTKRQVSGGTKSDVGRDCRDAFLGLSKTRRKLGVAFWDYLGDRPRVPRSLSVPYLPTSSAAADNLPDNKLRPGVCPGYGFPAGSGSGTYSQGLPSAPTRCCRRGDIDKPGPGG